MHEGVGSRVRRRLFSVLVRLFRLLVVVAWSSRRRQSPYSVQARVYVRAEMYILNVLVTYLPMFVLYLRPTLFTNELLRIVASVLEFSGGLFEHTHLRSAVTVCGSLVGRTIDDEAAGRHQSCGTDLLRRIRRT